MAAAGRAVAPAERPAAGTAAAPRTGIAAENPHPGLGASGGGKTTHTRHGHTTRKTSPAAEVTHGKDKAFWGKNEAF